MTKTVEVDISIREILIIMKQRWKLIFILAVVFAVLCGGYGIYKAKSESTSAEPVTHEEQVAYEQALEGYKAFQESQEKQPEIIRHEWTDIYNDQKTNPIFNVNPYYCEYEQIVIRFADKGNYDKTLDNWIAEADTDALFGNSVEEISQYRNSLIYTDIDEDEFGTQYDSDETLIQVIKVKGFDSSKAAEYLSSYIRQRADDADLDIQGLSTVSVSGYNKNVAAYQRTSRESLTSIYNSLNSISNMKNVYREPALPHSVESSGIKKIVKYGFAGLILGIILGVGLAILFVLRKGAVISRRQLGELFDMELLSDFSRGSEAALEVFNANLDLMSSEKSRIMLIGDFEDEAEAFASKCSLEGSRKFIAGCNIFEDADNIEMLQNTDGIALCIRLGETKIDKIQRVLLRANKLGKPVLGYVLI